MKLLQKKEYKCVFGGITPGAAAGTIAVGAITGGPIGAGIAVGGVLVATGVDKLIELSKDDNNQPQKKQ